MYIYITYIDIIYGISWEEVFVIYIIKNILEDSMMDDEYKDRNLGAVRLETKISFAF